MDLQGKHRILGAFIWLLLLVIVVPTWYGNPVNFSPDKEERAIKTLPTVEHAYRLPLQTDSPLTDGQIEHIENEQKKVMPTLKEENQKSPQIPKSETLNSDVDGRFVDKYSDIPEYRGHWIVRLQAFNNIRQANKLADKLSHKHPVYVKYFPRTKVYSLRTGPYETRVKAEKAKQKLDKMLRTSGEVKQLP